MNFNVRNIKQSVVDDINHHVIDHHHANQAEALECIVNSWKARLQGNGANKEEK